MMTRWAGGLRRSRCGWLLKAEEAEQTVQVGVRGGGGGEWRQRAD